ncbi:mitochondrial pyruvate carrier family protein [Ascoidea rubescens DSM 1968]|uniref:Mitochondrial pyruvate carrier n=1 Tax=Ascoidea rubescens DSM 1968 TaxID=1344418 RepID=A0A1D2VGT0_9ASCO|nr:UPF0041-domain-containing protein [Ascoidea rubescens DSM 1968]ODV60809.1 UPF0041-domain-containing protein [Ascoidea rubescens DSM 1968]
MASRAFTGKFARFMNSETGPKTIHFWAPTLKWALVIAGISDIKRPVDSLSGTQQFALLCTGAIWTRWSLIIKPKNYLLASVNFFLGSVAGIQIGRIVYWRNSQGDSIGEIAQYIANGKAKETKEVAPAPVIAKIIEKA